MVDQKWDCATRTYTSVRRKRIEYQIHSDGIYAVIFMPKLDKELYQDESYCGMLCKDKRLVFIFTLIIVPVFVLLFFAVYKMYALRTKEANATTENLFLKKKMQEIENVQIDFAGQTVLEKLDEGVQYFTNALRNEDEENLEDIKALNYQRERLNAERKRLAQIKSNYLYVNKEKIEEIRRLREEIDNLQ